MEGENREQKLRDKIFPPVVVIRLFSENCVFILVNHIQVVKASKELNASSSREKGRFWGRCEGYKSIADFLVFLFLLFIPPLNL